MNKFYLLLIPITLFLSCTNEQNDSNDSAIENTMQYASIDTIIEVTETQLEEIETWDGDYTAFNGNYFSILYPSNFTADPIGPKDQMDDYEFIQTDEATFTSPDGAVEFFVYSPLWGGEPEYYLEFLENEEITEEKETTETDEYGFTKTIQWMTFADKDGAYSRSYVSTETESTFLVFGIKSINEAAYEQYKERYLKFKESLEQYADA